LDVIILSLLIMGEERGGGRGGWLRPQTGLPGAKPARQISGFLSSVFLSTASLYNIFHPFSDTVFIFKRLSVLSVMTSLWFFAHSVER
jgi:hypothetical protein